MEYLCDIIKSSLKGVIIIIVNVSISFLILRFLWMLYSFLLKVIDLMRSEQKIDRLSIDKHKGKASLHALEQLELIKIYSIEIMDRYSNFYDDVTPIISDSQFRLKSLIIDRTNAVVDSYIDPFTEKPIGNIKETAGKLVFALNLIGEVQVIVFPCRSEDRRFKEEYFFLEKYKPFHEFSMSEIERIHKDFFDFISYTSAYLGSTKYQRIKVQFIIIKSQIIKFGYLLSTERILRNLIGKE
ncbi:hypothetical protein LEP1GSC052_0079 [Leptospira phage vb_LkmZ_Bejolso9-LE1]|nr:hypothetical protein LEP1GSC052_0079 [Leptospira phage vb_LkmZ_Bejolso9-LE1]